MCLLCDPKKAVDKSTRQKRSGLTSLILKAPEIGGWALQIEQGLNGWGGEFEKFNPKYSQNLTIKTTHSERERRERGEREGGGRERETFEMIAHLQFSQARNRFDEDVT